MNKPKRQHFIPKMHLKHFSGNDPQGHVWTYDAEMNSVRSSIPDETAVQTHFYSVEMPDGTMDTQVEKYLSGIESNATPVYLALLRGELLGHDQQKADFSTFLALMLTRTPAMRRMYGEIHSRGLQITNFAYGSHDKAFAGLMKRYEAAEKVTLSDDLKEKVRASLLDPSDYVIEIPKETTLRVLAIADKLAPIFVEMNWSLIIPRHGFFISSDNPLVRIVDPKTHHPLYGDHGFLNKTVQVTFPLSPKCMLVMTWMTPNANIRYVERAVVDQKNRITAFHSDRYLYSHVHHKHIRALALEFRNHRPQMGTDGFGPENFAETKVMRRRN